MATEAQMLRIMAKTIISLQVQLVQMENLVKELRIKLLEKQNAN